MQRYNSFQEKKEQFSYLIVEQIHMYRKKKITIGSCAHDMNSNDVNNNTFLNDLNPEQNRAVTCPTTQSTLVLSGAGLFYIC